MEGRQVYIRKGPCTDLKYVFVAGGTGVKRHRASEIHDSERRGPGRMGWTLVTRAEGAWHPLLSILIRPFPTGLSAAISISPPALP